jgi:hypothetical protein
MAIPCKVEAPERAADTGGQADLQDLPRHGQLDNILVLLRVLPLSVVVVLGVIRPRVKF